MASTSAPDYHPVTGAQPGPYPVGVTTTQLADHKREDPDGGPRKLQAEIWYPAEEEARQTPTNLFSEFLGRGVLPEYFETAEHPEVFGGYREGLTVTELDLTFQNIAHRDVRVRAPPAGTKWPVVVFSEGFNAFKSSSVYFCEYLASHGYVVVFPEHTGNCRLCIIDGKVIRSGGARQEKTLEDRPLDCIFILDTLTNFHLGADSRFCGRLDMTRCAMAGLSYGAWTTALVMNMQDPRFKCCIMQVPGPDMKDQGLQIKAPTFFMMGAEDLIIKEGMVKVHEFWEENVHADKYLMELKRGGHVTMTSVDQYNPNFGGGLGTSNSFTKPGEMYEPIPALQAKFIVNNYALAFLDLYLNDKQENKAELQKNSCEEELTYKFKVA